MTPFRPIDVDALVLLASRSDASEFKRSRLVAKIRKDAREGRLHYGPREDPHHAWMMCEARLMLGDWSDWGGWQFRSDWAAGWAENRVKDGVGRWKGQWVERLYVYGEQGLGDEVFFGTALKWLKTRVGEVVLETDPRLCSVFTRLGISCVPTVIGATGRSMATVDGDAWTLLGDLIVRSGPRPQPYLTALPSEVERFAKYKGMRGLSWRGNQGSYGYREFGYGLSLQYDQGWDEDVDIPEGLDLRNDIEGLLGLLSNLSEVVTVSTSVAHLASALGVPTHVVLAPRNGPNSTVLPWKWSGDWYGSTVYRDSRDYWARRESGGAGVGSGNRQALSGQVERPELAEA